MKPHLFVSAVSCLGCATPARSTMRDSARQYFDAKVYPILAAKCATCHIGADASDIVDYDSLHAPVVALRPGHMFDYSDADLRTILEWLRLMREDL